jgi:hypothetical protein
MRTVTPGRLPAAGVGGVGSSRAGTADRRRFPLQEWVAGDPALRLLRTEKAYPQTVYTYRVLGRLDPRSCPARSG